MGMDRTRASHRPISNAAIRREPPFASEKENTNNRREDKRLCDYVRGEPEPSAEQRAEYGLT